jgi:glucokinase
MTGAVEHAIGIDVGGTKIAGGVVDLGVGAVLARRIIPTRPERGGESVLQDVLALDAALRGDAAGLGVAPLGTGLGVCELVNTRGHITSGYTVTWNGVPVRDRLAAHGPATVEADVRAHALAEARYGAGRQYRLFVFVTVGTGISSCLVQEGRPLAGARGNALVLASSPLTTTCQACGTIQRQVLEEFASGPAIAARYQAATGTAGRSTEEVLAAAHAGDTEARAIITSAGAALGVSIGWLANVLDPEAVIIGGGLGTAGGLYWETMVASAREHIWSDETRSLPIIRAALGPDAGLIGAAAGVL